MENNELQHYGVLGMRWGFRRYQNKDGTLTKAGKKRYNQEQESLKEKEKVLKRKMANKAKFEKLDAKRKQLSEMEESLKVTKNKSKSETTSQDSSTTKVTTPIGDNKTSRVYKPLNQMSDNELKDLAARYEAKGKVEKYLSQQKAKKEGYGKKILKKLLDDAVIPAVTGYAKQGISNWLNSRTSESGSKSSSSTLKRKPTIIKAKPDKIYVRRDTPAYDIFNNAGLYLDMGRSVVSGLLPERTRDD